MADGRAEPRQMPMWAAGLVAGLAGLFWLSGVGYGLMVGRDAAVARPESAAGLDRYAQPLIFGPLIAAGVLGVWLGSRRRAEPGAAADGGA